MYGRLKIFMILAMFSPTFVFGAAKPAPTANTETQQNDVSTENTGESDEVQSFYNMLKELNWDTSSDSKRVDIFNRVKDAIGKKDKNTEDLQKNYEDLKAKQQSTANKTLTSLSVAATGLGAMELMQGLSEKKADEEAEADMKNYISTMRCSYVEGKSVKAGPEEIELPGGNDGIIMKYRSEYLALAADLKERKEALGMKPGIEAEEILDKANMGLYDDEFIGITAGEYGSLYRAQFLGSEDDQAKLNKDKDATSKRVKGGAIAAGLGILGGIVGNLAINKNGPKDKSKELLNEREKIASDLNDVMKQVVDECNENITNLKNNIPSKQEYTPSEIDDAQDMSYEEYVKMVNDLKPLSGTSDLERIKDIPVCK